MAPAGLLAEVTASTALSVRNGVLGAGQRADRRIATEMRQRRDLALSDHRFLSAAIQSWFRWRGWVEPMAPERFEAQLLFANLLDATSVHPACRVWARQVGRDPDRLMALGDAPDWTARTEGFKRLVGGQPVTVDPWRLFPDWFRPLVPLPPGDGPPKARFVHLIDALQTPPPLWVRAQSPEPERVWNELRSLGLKPWLHRRIEEAARLDRDADVPHLPPFERGLLEVQDLASQIVGRVCDPEPGERWWDACTGAGGKALHLAAQMQGKGNVVATDTHTGRLKEAVKRARRSPYRNITTKAWDGKHVVGKTGSYAGVLVDAPCSGLGTWRRNPEARWTLDPEAVTRLATLQGQILHTASAGVKPGGLLVYAVCTFTTAETKAITTAFLKDHPQFKLDPFSHPLSGEPTDGTLQLWPHEADSDAMYIARFVRNP